ncbi:MAG: hypothetical protein HN509_03150 [Halobacteriovoraceae bacterium]|nr:hypothetical protein [Halobacteriovoraceae bacterium]
MTNYLAIFLMLLTLISCQGSEEAVVISAPQAQASDNDRQLPDYSDEDTSIYTDEEDGELDPSDEGEVIGASNPCFRQLSNPQVELIASCSRVVNGRLNDGYKYLVKQSHLCLVRKNTLGKEGQFLVEGFIRETDKRNNNYKRKVKVEGVNVGEDQLYFLHLGEDLDTEITFAADSERLLIKQRTNGTFSKRKRYAAFSCYVF